MPPAAVDLAQAGLSAARPARMHGSLSRHVEGGRLPGLVAVVARVLSRPAVELMATDPPSAAQKAASPFFPGFRDARGWGLGVSVVTRREDLAGVPGRFGWEGAFGCSLYVDPREQRVGVLMAQCRPAVLQLPAPVQDFWTSVYQAIVD